jgi:AcrR family transcriptional regulator
VKNRSTPTKRALNHRTVVGRQRRERTQTRIVSAAMRVFAEKGPEAAVIDDFVREAGIARGTFYNYFTRTDELLLAVSKALEDALIRAIEEVIEPLEPGVERVACGVRSWLAWAQHDPTGCGFVVRSRFRGPLVEKRLASDLRDGLRAGDINVPSVAVGRDLVVGTVLEAMHRLLSGPVAPGYLEEVTEVVLMGLGVDRSAVRRLLRRPVPVAAQFTLPFDLRAPSSPTSPPSPPRSRPAASARGPRRPPARSGG